MLQPPGRGAYGHDTAIRIEAVGVIDSQYYDRTITIEQFTDQVIVV